MATNGTQTHLLGFDIGGTKCGAVVGMQTADGFSILKQAAFATRTAPTPEAVLARLDGLAHTLLHDLQHAMTSVAAVGISCGGPLDPINGVVLGPPNLPGWDRVPVRAYFEERLRVPAYLQNDADASALAEWQWGAGAGSQNLVFLTFGTGMGAGLILNGQLYTGACGNAGEVGHVRLAPDGPVGYGKAGSFEGFCSGGGIRRLAIREVRAAWARDESVTFCQGEADLEGLDAERVAAAARGGDPLARRIFKVSGTYLGQGLSLLIDVLNPDTIVIGSIFARAHDLLWPQARQVIEAEALAGSAAACRIVPAALGDEIGDYAALAAAAYGMQTVGGNAGSPRRRAVDQ